MALGPKFTTMGTCAEVKGTVRYVITGYGLPQIVRTVGIFRAVVLLGVVAVPREMVGARRVD